MYLSLQNDSLLPHVFASSERLKGFTYLTKASSTADARFPACPSAKDFGHLQDERGLYSSLMTQLKNVRREKMNDISRCLSDSPTLQVLATQMLTHSVAFIEELLSFMSQTFLVLTESFSGDDKAWDCVCKSVQDLFISQFVPARSQMVSADLSERSLLAHLVVWTSLRICSVAVDLTNVKLASHPDVTSSYVRFLIDQFGDKQSSALKSATSTIASMKDEIVSLKKELNNLKSHIGSVESRGEKMKKK